MNLNNTDIVILAGGLGKRLQALTQGKQKVLVPINGTPFLALLIDFIAAQGGQRFIVCTGHGAQAVEQALAGMFPKLDIVFSREEEPLGTGGAIKQAAALVRSSRFLAMNGDCFCVIDYGQLIDRHVSRKAAATIAVTRLDDARDYGTIEIGADGRIEAFKEKQPALAPALINTGTYCLNKDVFDLAETPQKFSIEYDFFPRLVGKGFWSFEVANKFVDIGTPERYQWAQEHLKELN